MARLKEQKPDINLLELVPRRLIEHELGDDKLVILHAPRFKAKWLRKLFEPRLKQPFLKVNLDEIGTEVWLNIDGVRDIKEIADMMKEKFKDKIEPCYDRLGLFMAQLERSRFICYTNIEECRAAARHKPSQREPESRNR